jgi:hypothetical protein
MQSSSGSDNTAIGINLNSTSATPSFTTATAALFGTSVACRQLFLPVLGFNYAQAMEAQLAGGTGTFYGLVNGAQQNEFMCRVDM